MTDYSNIRGELFQKDDTNSVTLWNGSSYISVDNLSILNNANQQLVNAVATGPQDDFYEKLDRANLTLNRYCNMNYYGYRNNYDYVPNVYLSVGNNWNWKPGTYDKIKEAIKTILCLDKKCMSTGKLVQRTRDMSHRLHSIETRLAEVERLKKYLKENNYSPNVDVTEYREMLTQFSNDVEKECEKIKVFNKDNVNVEIIPFLSIPEGNERNARFYLSINLSGLIMNIVQDESTIHKQPMNDIHLYFNIGLRDMIKSWKDKSSTRAIKSKGLYLSDEYLFPGSYQNAHCFEHPYLSAPSYDFNKNMMLYGNVCLDNYTDDVYSAICKVDYISLIMNLINWATYYSTNYSNPYNQPYKMHFGMDKSVSSAYLSLFSNKADCVDRKQHKYGKLEPGLMPYDEKEDILVNNFVNSCDSEKCINRDSCGTYKMYSTRVALCEKDNEETYNKIYSILGFAYEYFSNIDNTREHNEILSDLNEWMMNLWEAPYLSSLDAMARYLVNYTNIDDFGLKQFEEILTNIRYFPEEELTEEEIIKRTADEMLQWATERRA